jgi:hypothetical protein
MTPIAKDALVEQSATARSSVIPPEVDFTAMIARIRAGDPKAKEEAAWLFSGGIRLLLSRQLKPHMVEEQVRKVLFSVIQAIETEKHSEPGQLLGFVRTVINSRIQAILNEGGGEAQSTIPPGDSFRHSCTPERVRDFAEEVRRKMSVREREILRSYYVRREPPESIQCRYRISGTQFELIISRARSLFEELRSD